MKVGIPSADRYLVHGRNSSLLLETLLLGNVPSMFVVSAKFLRIAFLCDAVSCVENTSCRSAVHSLLLFPGTCTRIVVDFKSFVCFVRSTSISSLLLS